MLAQYEEEEQMEFAAFVDGVSIRDDDVGRIKDFHEVDWSIPLRT